jgi:uncharacterized protein (DUF1499 family)
MDEQVKRARTEALFRDVNERIAESAQRFEADSTQFVCECADPNCTERVPASLMEYEKVRAEPTTFLMAPGHEQHDLERVISTRPKSQIVEKVQAAARRTVKRLDPRGRRGPSAPSEGSA